VDAVQEPGPPVARSGALVRDRAEEFCGLGEQRLAAALGTLGEVDQGLTAFRVDLLGGEVVQGRRVVGAALAEVVAAPVDGALETGQVAGAGAGGGQAPQALARTTGTLLAECSTAA
jgi:hypothetical protein